MPGQCSTTSELEPDTVDNWAVIPAYRDALMSSIGQEGFDTMKSESERNMADFTGTAEQLYKNFMKQV